MSAFYDNNVTDVGRLLLGDVQMGASFVPTKIVIGKGYLPQGKTTRTMTDVADVVKELALNKATKNPDGDAIFGAIFSNEDIQEAFYYRELGLYAKGVYYNQSGGVERETAEVLYSYGNAGENAELIPAYSTGSVVERQLDLLVYIGNDTEVKLEIETGLYVTIPVFNDTVERLEKDIEEVRYIVDSTTAKKYEWAMESGTLSLDEVGGDTKINIADKETLDAVKEKVDLIHTNTEGLSGKIGETNDSGGSEAAGSVFAKLNKIIGDIAAHVKQWTAERAAKLDQLDTINENAQTASTKATELVEDVAELKAAAAQETTVKDISNKIGAEGDEDTQPTLFGRIAKVLKSVLGIDGKIGNTNDSLATTQSGSLMGKSNAILGVVGYVKDVNGKKYAAVMDGSETPLKVDKQTSDTYSPVSCNMLQDEDFIYFFEASRIVKINKTTMEQVAVNTSFTKTIKSACMDSTFIYANVEDRSDYGTIYKFKKSDLTKVAQTSSTYNYDGAVYCDENFLYALRDMGDYITKMNKSNLSDIESTGNQSISSMTPFAIGSEYVYMTNRGGVYKHLKTNISTKSEFCKVSYILGLLIDGDNLYVVHGSSGGTSVNITAYSLANGSSVASATVNIGRKNEKGIVYTTIDDTYIYLYDEVSTRKIYKILKNNLKVANQTEQTYAEPFCVDSTGIYAATSAPGKITKIKKTSDSVYNISSFKEV